MLDLNAELIPGKAGAGVLLGQSATSILAVIQPENIESRQPLPALPELGCRVLKFGSVWLFEQKEVVSQVCVFAGYAGKINGSIGIASTVAEVQATLGPVVDYEGVCFGVATLPGWCFEVEESNSAIKGPDWLALRLSSICIYAEDN